MHSSKQAHVRIDMVAMRNMNNRQARLRHSAYALVCLLASRNCESFQPGALPHSSRKVFSTSESTYKTTSLYARTFANGVMEKKMNATTIASNVVSKTTRIRKSPPKLKMEDVDESSYVIKDELLGHELLTADEEKVLGRKIRRAVKLKAAMAEYVEQKKQEELERHLEEESYVDDLTQDLFLDRRSDFTGEGDEDLEGLSVIDYQIIDFQRNRLEAFDRKSLHKDKDIDSWDYDRLRQTSHSTMESDASSLLGSDYSSLTDEEVMEQFGLAGGRDELARIVVEGALAKEKMISCNIRLVVSIAKKWCQRSPAGLTGGLSQYAGSFDTPSLDEAVQEGIFGLSTAAERFEPERNLKFGTYATHWVTNSIRNCFNQAREVGVRVPVYFHLYRQKYQAYVRDQYRKTGDSVSLEDAAKELELSPERLTFMLTSTTSPVSIDAAPNSRSQGQAGKAGADDQLDGSFTLANVLKCNEPTLLDQIEVSLLRQALENAMATELSPHERDVLRLRHGLDDGVSRTIRQVAEICGGSLSQSDVRTAEIRACRKLRSPYSVHTVQLHEFLDFVGGDISTVSTRAVKPKRSP